MKKSGIKIFIRCPNWVGDVVMATPLFKCIRDNYPDAFIVAGIRKYSYGVIQGAPWFDSVIFCDDKTLGTFFKTAKEIRAGGFDKAILLTNSARAFLSVFLGGAKEIYGYRRNVQGFFVTDGPSPVLEEGRIKPLPMTDYYMEICRKMNLAVPKEISTELFVSDEDEAEAEKIFEMNGISKSDIVIGLNPGARFGASKCWPVENFAKFADIASGKLKAKVILFSGPGEKELAGSIIKLSETRIIHLGSLSLSLLKALVKRLSILVTNDTGPRHFATAFGVPALVLMGSTNRAFTDYRLDITTVLRVDLECSPCHKKICPTDHRCMTSITPQMVIDETGRILGEKK